MSYMGGISFERRRDAWPDVPPTCPECAAWGLTEKPLGDFVDGTRMIQYDCGTRIMSDQGNPWYVAARTPKCKENRARFEA